MRGRGECGEEGVCVQGGEGGGVSEGGGGVRVGGGNWRRSRRSGGGGGQPAPLPVHTRGPVSTTYLGVKLALSLRSVRFLIKLHLPGRSLRCATLALLCLCLLLLEREHYRDPRLVPRIASVCLLVRCAPLDALLGLALPRIDRASVALLSRREETLATLRRARSQTLKL